MSKRAKPKAAPFSRGGGTAVRSPGASLRPAAAIRKFGPVDMVANGSPRLRPEPRAPYTACTYVAIEQSCPDSCSFKAPGENGVRPCFAGAGFTKKLVGTLEREARRMTPEQVATAEANVIDRAFSTIGKIPQDGARGGRDLRLHVSGDCRTEPAARILGAAAGRWLDRGGGSVWSYTHAFRVIPREAWGRISVIASVEKVSDVAVARDRGYAAAIVLRDTHTTERVWSPTEAPDVKIIHCPYETRKVTCGQCRLCLDRDLLKLGLTIGFSMHGTAAKEGRRRLPVIT